MIALFGPALIFEGRFCVQGKDGGETMKRIVMKFGGTSVANPERIARAAKLVIGEVNRGKKVAVVVSAMGKTTDDFIALAGEVNPNANRRELDMLLATGEQITASLLAMAIVAEGMQAQSFTGWQAGVTTESVHGNARIEYVHAEKIVKSIDIRNSRSYCGFPRN